MTPFLCNLDHARRHSKLYHVYLGKTILDKKLNVSSLESTAFAFQDCLNPMLLSDAVPELLISSGSVISVRKR